MDVAKFFTEVARRRGVLLAIVLTPRDYETLREHVKQFTYLHAAWRSDGNSFMGVPVVRRQHTAGASWLLLDDHEGVVLEVLQ